MVEVEVVVVAWIPFVVSVIKVDCEVVEIAMLIVVDVKVVVMVLVETSVVD